MSIIFTYALDDSGALEITTICEPIDYKEGEKYQLKTIVVDDKTKQIIHSDAVNIEKAKGKLTIVHRMDEDTSKIGMNITVRSTLNYATPTPEESQNIDFGKSDLETASTQYHLIGTNESLKSVDLKLSMEYSQECYVGEPVLCVGGEITLYAKEGYRIIALYDKTVKLLFSVSGEPPVLYAGDIRYSKTGLSFPKISIPVTNCGKSFYFIFEGICVFEQIKGKGIAIGLPIMLDSRKLK